MPEQTVESPPVKWWPVYHKVWAATGGAALGASAAVIELAHPLAIVTRDVMSLSPEGLESAEKIWIVVLAILGAAIAGYLKSEPAK